MYYDGNCKFIIKNLMQILLKLNMLKRMIIINFLLNEIKHKLKFSFILFFCFYFEEKKYYYFLYFFCFFLNFEENKKHMWILFFLFLI